MSYIKNWKAPIWHVDFGDADKELEVLKEACFFLLDINDSFSFLLDCYEEGYMRIIISHNDNVWGELIVSDIESKKLGIFKSDDKEFYFRL